MAKKEKGRGNDDPSSCKLEHSLTVATGKDRMLERGVCLHARRTNWDRSQLDRESGRGVGQGADPRRPGHARGCDCAHGCGRGAPGRRPSICSLGPGTERSARRRPRRRSSGRSEGDL